MAQLPDIETFARGLEALGRARATVTRRLCTVAGSCRYAVEEELLDHSPAEHALISLLALNGLRVSEATGADIDHLGLEQGHRTLVITRKGGNPATAGARPADPPQVRDRQIVTIRC